MAEVSRVDKVRRQGRGAVVGALWAEIRALRQQSWGNPLGYIFVGPGVLLYFVFAAYPIVRGLIMAFQDYRFLIPETRNPLVSFNGLANWIELAQDPRWWHSFKVALVFTLGTFPANVILGLAAAVLIASIPSPFWTTVARTVVYMPVIVPISVAMLAWGMIYDQDVGYLSYFVTKVIPLTDSPPKWLGFGWALPATMVAWVWTQFGYNTILFLVGIYGINRELYEAASIDGANAWNRFRHVTLPALKPTFTLIFVLNAGIVSATVPMMILTKGGPAEETLTAGLYLYRQAFSTEYSDMRMGYAAAMNLVLGLIHVALASIVFKIMGTERN
ncbi:MAG: sugar ABC transporter permease [Chloroflexi bacterium]|nr:sugar ABC transporter permease [Chloroflexota bacterium]